MKKRIIAAALAVFGAAVQADVHHNHGSHHEHLSQAPAGVMGDHVHRRGDWMFSYSYMRMHMDGMRDGSDGLSAALCEKGYGPHHTHGCEVHHAQ